MTEPPLFAEGKRTDRRRGKPHETHYEFLHRAAGEFFDNVRAVLNEWFARFADTQAPEAVRDLRGRFRGKQPEQLLSAFWELYLHEMAVRLGFQVVVHPESERGTHPDFVLSRGEERLYVEAVMPTPGIDNRKQPGNVPIVEEYINEAFHPAWRLSLVHIIPGKDTPRKIAVKKAVLGWLETLDPDEWLEREGEPEEELHLGHWQIKLLAYPMPPENRDREGKAMIWFGVGGAAYPEAIGPAILPLLTEKATKYGDLDAPLVIAMWVNDIFADRGSAPLVLFDSTLGHLKLGTEPTGLNVGKRKRKGLWTPGAKHRGRASAVLAVDALNFGYPNVPDVLPHLWPNPHADNPLTTDLPFSVSRVSPDEETVETVGAKITASELFGLPEEWPGELDFHG